MRLSVLRRQPFGVSRLTSGSPSACLKHLSSGAHAPRQVHFRWQSVDCRKGIAGIHRNPYAPCNRAGKRYFAAIPPNQDLRE